MKKRFAKRYPKATIPQWREIWAKHRDRLRAIVARELEAQNWKHGWAQVSCYCTNLLAFEPLVYEWQRQCAYFADKPEIITENEEILRSRWQQLSVAS